MADSIIAGEASVVLSQLLGYTVSAGSALVKLPQLLTLLRSRSTVGLSLSMYSIELFSQSIAVLYHQSHGFPLSTYGENLSLGAGNIAILACFAKFNRDPRAFLSLAFPLVLSPLVRYPSILTLLQSLSIPFNIASKLPQIVINFHIALALDKQIKKARDENEAAVAANAVALATTLSSCSITAGASVPPLLISSSSSSRRLTSPSSHLSPVPFLLNFLGSASRLYTTMTQLGGDRLMLLGFAISCVLNGLIVLQCKQITRLQRLWTEEREKTRRKGSAAAITDAVAE